MSCAEVISLDQVRARTHWTTLRQQLHERFDRWLDRLEAALPEGEPALGQVSETIWALRQQLTGGVAETIVHHTYSEEQQRSHMPCPTCTRLLPARGPVPRCVETLVGVVALERPYFYCPGCRTGTYPLDEVIGVQTGPKDGLPQCGNTRLCRVGVTPAISTHGSQMWEAPFCLYAA